MTITDGQLKDATLIAIGDEYDISLKDDNVDDEASNEDSNSDIFNITSYGADVVAPERSAIFTG
ncbi:hypothetical protein FHS77_002929 [Paenochrobactrum gallinarii]|uniref:Uncharacterized protein n=1 Tax=Paenochrobactrum gallinarii TaxID=643673 RepID=A0A841M0S8_9HYPH|nr:hypothetical protein [Paenochrobactrum gallinarii]MBB6262357.1 hypothetical protein [Paenochrobactrum gallinarii]